MTPPTTQEELDRRENMSAKVNIIGDILNLLSDLEPAPRLEITDALLSEIITDAEVKTILEEEIEKLRQQEEEENSEDEYGEDEYDNDFSGSYSGGGGGGDYDLGGGFDDFNDLSAGGEEVGGTEEGGGEEMALPAMSDLGVDFADNTGAE